MNISRDKVKSIRLLHKLGADIKTISIATGLSDNTIRSIIMPTNKTKSYILDRYAIDTHNC